MRISNTDNQRQRLPLIERQAAVWPQLASLHFGRIKPPLPQRSRAMRCSSVVLMSLIALFIIAPQSPAQYSRIGTPFQTNSDSFYERIGIDFGFSFPQMGNPNGTRIVGLNPDGSFTRDGAIRFTQGGAASAVPPFGGYDPNADATFGFARVNPNGGGWHLGLRAGQGSSRTSTVNAPSIVVPNGVPGSISNSQLTPFVTNVIPVVGGLPEGFFQAMYSPGPAISPVDVSLARLREEMAAGRIYRDENGRFVVQGETTTETSSSQAAPAPRESTAMRGDLSVAEIRRLREAAADAQDQENQAQIEKYIRLAESAASKRKYGAAKHFYRNAAALATGNLKQELESKQEEMRQRADQR